MSEDDKPRGEPAVKAKLPSAKNIRSPEFKPHGLGGDSRNRGPRPSGLTAAQAKKRRLAMIVGVVVVACAIGGATAFYLTRPGPEIKVSGTFGTAPKVSIPKDLAPGGKLAVNTPIKGTGDKIANGDLVYARHTFYQWAKGTGDKAKTSTNKELASTYKDETAKMQPLLVGKSGVKGVDKGLVGQTVGSRVVLQVPPSDGFGEQAQQVGVSPTDSLVFVIDVLDAMPQKASAQGTEKKLDDKKLPEVKAGKPGEAPKVTIPKEDAPKDLQVKPLIEGTGPALAKGETALVQYQGQLWKNGKVFDSSWAKQGGMPAMFPIGTGGTVPGFDKGLTGQKVGSRVMLVLPPKEGYGEKGMKQAGIGGDDTLVFVVDILGKLPK